MDLSQRLGAGDLLGHEAGVSGKRATFHLAENTNDRARPFELFSTFTEGLSETGQPPHLPLAGGMNPPEVDRLQRFEDFVNCVVSICVASTTCCRTHNGM